MTIKWVLLTVKCDVSCVSGVKPCHSPFQWGTWHVSDPTSSRCRCCQNRWHTRSSRGQSSQPRMFVSGDKNKINAFLSPSPFYLSLLFVKSDLQIKTLQKYHLALAFTKVIFETRYSDQNLTQIIGNLITDHCGRKQKQKIIKLWGWCFIRWSVRAGPTRW